MENQPVSITIEAIVNAPVETVWKLWTGGEHIIKWNNASPDWHTPSASNDLKVGGKFSYRMEAKDGSFGFDFFGEYDTVIQNECIGYTLGDGRKAMVYFKGSNNQTNIIETFEAETENPVDMQRFGWQAILNNFKQYAEKIA